MSVTEYVTAYIKAVTIKVTYIVSNTENPYNAKNQKWKTILYRTAFCLHSSTFSRINQFRVLFSGFIYKGVTVTIEKELNLVTHTIDTIL